jgi:hypothetical protein
MGIEPWRFLRQRRCMHQELQGWPKPDGVARTWLCSALVDTGMRKMWWCTHCEQTWWG